MLLNAKASVDIQNNSKSSALFYAVFSRNEKIITKILDAKAQLDIKDYYNNTVFDYAYNDKENKIKDLLIKYNKMEIIEQLIQVLPLPIAGGHIVLFEWIVDYTL